MFPNLAARETCVAETNFAARKTKNVFASRTEILRPKHMFPSLATPGNITRNIVAATMFPSLARPLRLQAGLVLDSRGLGLVLSFTKLMKGSGVGSR